MRFKSLCAASIVLFCASSMFGQEQPCRGHTDLEGLLQFLQDHWSNSLEADPQCVRRAFADLGSEKKYTQALIGLLDFERNYEGYEKLIFRGSQYPALSALAHPYAVPYLIKAIKEKENEVARINAAEALEIIYPTCVRISVSMLEREANKPDTTPEQQDHLRDVEKYINEHLGSHPCNVAPPAQ